MHAASESPNTSAAPNTDDAAQYKGRGIALLSLFFAEAWERFSYYGMRALLVLYCIKYHQMRPSDASAVYKWYTSLVYLTPLFGGLLADRYLGLRNCIVIGGVLMAIGHGLMTQSALPFMYAALVFLIFGNGFFKPNMSTIVGKMYKQGDPARDAAFTVFYMGINLGAMLAPIVCGGLKDKYGWDYGFGAAGIGMLIGLVMFLGGQKRVLHFVALAGNDLNSGRAGHDAGKPGPDSAGENEPGATGIAATISAGFPYFFMAEAVILAAIYWVDFLGGKAPGTSVIMPTAFGAVFVWMALTLRTIKGAARDKSTVIFILFHFAVLFWMAFEQAGNALNIWADVNTELSMPGIGAYPAEWFQSVNPLLILAGGPVFAFLWVWFAKKQMEVPTGVKMFAAMVLMALSFAAMMAAAVAENGTTTAVQADAPPTAVDLKTLHAGRLTYDAGKHELSARGVVADFVVNDALAPVVDKTYQASVMKLEEAAKEAAKDKPVTFKLENLPGDYAFPLPMTGDGAFVTGFDSATGNVTVMGPMDPPSRTKLINAGAPAPWRNAMEDLSKQSQKARVSGFWLFLSYFLATLGELCLSPVGLSMVTKLAPVRFGALFMGVWLLSSSVAQYMGGALGELWGAVTPFNYFTIFVVTSIIGAALLAGLVAPIKKLMHSVK